MQADEWRAPDELPPALHTARRSQSAHYGAIRHALRYLLHVQGLSVARTRHVSLLLRLQMLRLAQHDLKFVRSVSAAERTILHIAARQLAYKALKLGRAEATSTATVEPSDPASSSVSAMVVAARPDSEAMGGGGEGAAVDVGEGGVPEGESALLDVAQLAQIRNEATQLLDSLLEIPGTSPGATAPPPPLILSAADVHLLLPSLATLVGETLLQSPEVMAAAGPGAVPTIPSSALLDVVEVLGFYFSASWCPPCVQTTPLLATAYKQLRGRGKRFEIILVSQDRTAEAFDAYRGKMPFPSLPWGGKRIAGLVELFKVEGIPSLVLLDSAGCLISTDGVRLLRKHVRAFPWASTKPVETPHVLPNFERLRREPVDPGAPHDLPSYKPLDFLSQPQAVANFSQAVEALRKCDRLCTMVAVQSHSVLNTPFLVVSLVQHTFTTLLPLPAPEGAPDVSDCIWRSPMLYDEQLGIMLLLQRIVEHFAAASLTIDHTRSFDAVRMVVPACVAAVADVVMRQLATDEPSQVCIHLRGEGTTKRSGFALSAAQLATQSASVWVHTAELNTARSRVLDYFAAQEALPKIFGWSGRRRSRSQPPGVKPCLPTIFASWHRVR